MIRYGKSYRRPSRTERIARLKAGHRLAGHTRLKSRGTSGRLSVSERQRTRAMIADQNARRRRRAGPRRY